MLFNSFEFILFFLVVTTAYFIIPYRFRWLLLLAASCGFYMSFIPIYILVLATTILIDYFAGIMIEDSVGPKRKLFLIISILSTCLVLFIFKYFNFFTSNLAALASFVHWNYTLNAIKLILPIGLSFHTFQSLAYVIEVYRGNQKAERHFGIYALYVMFYPQLVAGPIERPQNLLHQFYEKHDFQYERVRDGLKLILWGMFKKVVIADRLSFYVHAVYGNVRDHNGTSLLLATIFFAFQIYCDFSGYSDIALGLARVMGFHLMQNFNKPYFSKSIAEFWKRWHISLSTWFKDYLYIPLGGNRVAVPRMYLNLFITFVISGLWHGANWTYIIWGALNGLYLIASIATAHLRDHLVALSGLKFFPRLHKVFKMLVTFSLVCAAWVFFRASSLSDALLICKKILLVHGPVFTGGFRDIIYGVMGIATLIAVDLWCRGKNIDVALSELKTPVRWAMYLYFTVTILMAGVFDKSQFIYFQF